jgi:hypothetical protein
MINKKENLIRQIKSVSPYHPESWTIREMEMFIKGYRASRGFF